MESLLNRSWSIFSLTSKSTTLPSLTITVRRPNRCFFRRARASSNSVASPSLTPCGRSTTEFSLSTVTATTPPELCTLGAGWRTHREAEMPRPEDWLPRPRKNCPPLGEVVPYVTSFDETHHQGPRGIHSSQGIGRSLA